MDGKTDRPYGSREGRGGEYRFSRGHSGYSPPGHCLLSCYPLPTAPHSPVVVVREFPPDPKVSQSLLLYRRLPQGNRGYPEYWHRQGAVRRVGGTRSVRVYRYWLEGNI